MHLLIVDDEPLILRSMERLFRKHTVVTAASVAEARMALRKHPIEGILSDVMMPNELGTELHRWVAKYHPHLTSQFVFMTGAVLCGEAQHYLDVHQPTVLAKPVPFDELRRRFE